MVRPRSLPPPERDAGVLTDFGRHRLMVYAPSTWKPDKNCAKAPELQLVREHVYGMDGSAPQSVHFTMDGRCVYIAARLCIIEDLLQPRQTYFEGHNADVLCLSLAPKLDLAISGQQEPPGVGSSYACVWCPSYPSRALCRLHCFLDRSGATKGDEVPRHRDRKEGEVDFPFWVDPSTIQEAQLRGISAVAIAASGRFAVMMALDDKRSIILFKLPACCAKPVTSEVSQTYVIRVPTMVVASGGNICELATTNPFDSERRFRFATLNKTAVKLYEYREASNELVHGAVIFGKAPQQHLNHVAYATEAGHLLMCGKEGRLYDVHGSHVHHSAVLSHQLGCAVSLWKIKGQSYEFLAADTTGTFLLGRFEEDPPAKPRKTRPLGIRPQVAERFTLEQLPAKPGQEFPKGLRPKWRSLAVNERGLVLAASEGHMLVIVDLGLTGQRRCIWRVVQVGHKVEAWALAHHPKIPGLCASGDERGVIHFWDLEQRKPLLEKTYRSDQTVHRLEFSPEGDLLVLGQLGIVTILEFPSLQSVHRRRVSFVKDFRGQEGEVISWIVFSNYADGEDSRYLACACWDQNIYLFRLVWRTKAGHKHKGSERHREIMYRGTLTGNSSSPTHVMFTADAQFLVSNSTDLSILVWRTGTGERLHCLAAVRDMPRAGPWRNIIGWPVAGVWKKSYAQSDVNAVCQSYGSGGQPDGDVLAVADDEHMVNLYRFPAPISLSQGRQYSGHASHVTNVQFSPSNVLVSLGGNDHTLMQWRLERAPAPLQPGRTTCSTPPKRTLPWAKDERPGSAATSAGSGSAGSGSRLNSTGSAEEVLQQLGEREKRRARPPRAPRLAPLHPRGEYTKMTGGYPGFKGPFEGEELRSARPTARSMSEEAPSSGSRPPRPHSTSSLGRDSPHRPSALHQPRLTPAALQCRRLASMRRL